MLREKIIGSKIKGNEVNYLTLAKPIDQDDTDFLQTDLLSAKEILKLIQNVQSADDGVELLDTHKYAYGIKFLQHPTQYYIYNKNNEGVQRIGNPELHKTLPIQSKFATCIHQGTNIKYQCDPNDNRFRKDAERYKFNIKLNIEETTTSNNKPKPDDYSPCTNYTHIIKFENADINKNSELNCLVTTYKYLYAWVKIDNIVCRINKIDFENQALYITSESSIPNKTLFNIELGCSINGYDGEIGVYTPKFYIWRNNQIDDDSVVEVFISEKKCVSYCTEIKSHITSISHCTVLKHKMNDNKWGWLNTLSDDTAVCVVNYQPNLRGGCEFIGSKLYDNYVNNGISNSALGKGFICRSLDEARKYSSKNNNGKVLYYQMWNAILWCYFIEYCTFTVHKPYTKELQEGLHVGGFGDQSMGDCFLSKHFDSHSLIPIDCTLCCGNNSGIIKYEGGLYNKHIIYAADSNYICPVNIASKDQIQVDKNDNSILHIKCDEKYRTYADDGSSFCEIGLSFLLNIGKLEITGFKNNNKVVFIHDSENRKHTLTENATIDLSSVKYSYYGGPDILMQVYGEGIDIKLHMPDNVDKENTEITIPKAIIPNYRGFNMFFNMGDAPMYIDNLLLQTDFSFTDSCELCFSKDIKKQFNNTIDNKYKIANIDYYVDTSSHIGPSIQGININGNCNITIKKNIIPATYSDSCYFFKGNDLLQDPLSIPYSVKTPSYIYHNDGRDFYISGLLSLTNGQQIGINYDFSEFSKCYTLN